MNKTLEGEIVSGVGRGAKFIALPVYYSIFYILINKSPFLGTLNLKLNDENAKTIQKEFKNGEIFDNLIYNGKLYGAIVTKNMYLEHNEEKLFCIGVRPLLTSHDSNVLEVVCEENIREYWNLKNGDQLSIKFS